MDFLLKVFGVKFDGSSMLQHPRIDGIFRARLFSRASKSKKVFLFGGFAREALDGVNVRKGFILNPARKNSSFGADFSHRD